MICSTPKIDSTLGSATYCPYKYFKNGEINQSVGLAVKKVLFGKLSERHATTNYSFFFY